LTVIAAWAPGIENEAALLEILKKAAADPDPRVRMDAAFKARSFTRRDGNDLQRKTWVSENQNPEVFLVIEALSRDVSPKVRQYACYALGDHPGTASTALLDQLLRDPDSAVRSNAAYALNRLREQAALRSELARDA
jgi:HEAT repeat protein